MAENRTGDGFKLAKKGGYDKEDVECQFQALRVSASMEKDRLQKEIAQKDKEIARLNEELNGHRNEIDDLHKNISEKYQSYIDYYDTIGEVILDSKIRAKKIVEDAFKEREQILSRAKAEVIESVEKAKTDVESEAQKEKERLEKANEEKRAEYNAICEKIASMMQQLETVETKVSSAVKHLREIVPNNSDLASWDEEDTAEDLDIADTQEFDFRGFLQED